MTIPYLDVLCSHISNVPEDKVLHLSGDSGFGFPQFPRCSVPDAVRIIRAYLESSVILKKRLMYIAKLYCDLMEIGVLRPWILYRMDGIGTTLSEITFWVKDMLESQGLQVECYCTPKPPLNYLCYMIPEDVTRMYYRHFCFCVSAEMPYIAIYKAPEGHAQAVARMLPQLLGGEPASLERGTYRDADAAFAAARQLL